MNAVRADTGAPGVAPAPPGTAAVLGLGLMGGSMARDLAARGWTVLGYDRDAASMEAARAEGVVQTTLDATLAGVEAASLVVLAVPVDAAVALTPRIAPRLRAARLIVDLGGTKLSLAAAMEAAGLGARYVGSHPLAGDHRSGWRASRSGLFRYARVFLCPAPSTEADALASAESLWAELGAQPERIDAGEHDLRLAWTSHLPQLASSALALALAGAGIARSELGPGGRDVTRLAGSSPEMWAAIARDNASHLGAAIAALEQRLHALRGALERDDGPELERCFRESARWHGAVTDDPDLGAESRPASEPSIDQPT
jgi:prephenate dehydrogenase